VHSVLAACGIGGIWCGFNRLILVRAGREMDCILCRLHVEHNAFGAVPMRDGLHLVRAARGTEYSFSRLDEEHAELVQPPCGVG
jgi:hypothetical protein